MRNILKKIIPVLVLMLLLSGVVLATTGHELMQLVDDQMYSVSTIMEAKMIIVNGDRQMTKEMTTYTKDDSAYIEFTNPRDRGSKFLKIDDQLWMRFPDSEEIVKISGHMLKEGFMGSDFSYQDAMESEKMADLYTFAILREETYADRPTYVVEGIKKDDAKANYYRRLAWIDKERHVPLKEELYAQSGTLLKVMIAENIQQIQGRWYPMTTVMENKLKQNTRTEFIVESVEFNADIPASIFELANLRE